MLSLLLKFHCLPTGQLVYSGKLSSLHFVTPLTSFPLLNQRVCSLTEAFVLACTVSLSVSATLLVNSFVEVDHLMFS